MKPVVNIKILADLKTFSKQMQNVNRKMEKTARKLQGIGSAMSLSVTAPVLLAGRAAINFASDFEESLNKVDVAFGKSGDSVRDFAKSTLTQFGIAEGSALDMAALFGDMATSMQLPQDEAAKMSTALVGLAGDLSSFKNIDIKQATTALNGVFTGETESLKMLGIVMTQANLAQFAMNQGITKTIKEMSEAEKVQLRYAYVMSRTANAHGDFAETGGGAANQMRVFSESLKQLAQQFGAVILPTFTKVVVKVNEMVSWISKMSPETKKLIVVMAGVAAAVGPLLALAGTILPAIGTGLALLTGPIGLVVAGLTAIGVIIYKNWKPIKQTLIDIANYFVDLYNESTAFRFAVENVSSAFKNLLAIGKYVFAVLGEIISGVWENLKNGVKTLGALIKAVLTGDIAAIPGIISDGFKEGWDNGLDAIQGIKEKFKPLKDAIQQNIEEGFDNALNGRKYHIQPDVVDASEAADKVADQIATGVQKGLSGRAKVSSLDTSGLTQGVMIESPLKLAAETISTHVAIIDEQMAKSTIALNTFKEVLAVALPEALNSFGQSFIDSLGLADHGFEGFVKNMGKTITKLISMLLSQAMAGSITNAVTSAGATGPAAIFTQPAFMATLVGGVLSAFAAIPKFEAGGITGGSSLYGDKILARLNSKELIMNQSMQKDAWNLMNNNQGDAGGVVTFEIAGDKLIGALKRGLRGNSRAGGNLSLT